LLYLSPIIGPVIIVAAKFKTRGRGAVYCKQNYIMKPTTIRRDYARAKARMVLNECGISRPPTDLEQICSKLGVKIHYHCTDGLKDSFMYLDRSIYNLVIAISGNQARDRWSLAHELGHVVLGHCQIYSVDTLSKDVLTDAERYILDRECDIFAEEILMPLAWMEKHKHSSIDQLKKVFGVSKEAVAIRHDNLFGKELISNKF
jgi:Zn-dependent peptidase ImmA (M78 family)